MALRAATKNTVVRGTSRVSFCVAGGGGEGWGPDKTCPNSEIYVIQGPGAAVCVLRGPETHRSVGPSPNPAVGAPAQTSRALAPSPAKNKHACCDPLSTAVSGRDPPPIRPLHKKTHDPLALPPLLTHPTSAHRRLGAGAPHGQERRLVGLGLVWPGKFLSGNGGCAHKGDAPVCVCDARAALVRFKISPVNIRSFKNPDQRASASLMPLL
jgi:hypothetical protein